MYSEVAVYYYVYIFGGRGGTTENSIERERCGYRDEERVRVTVTGTPFAVFVYSCTIRIYYTSYTVNDNTPSSSVILNLPISPPPSPPPPNRLTAQCVYYIILSQWTQIFGPDKSPTPVRREYTSCITDKYHRYDIIHYCCYYIPNI